MCGRNDGGTSRSSGDEPTATDRVDADSERTTGTWTDSNENGVDPDLCPHEFKSLSISTASRLVTVGATVQVPTVVALDIRLVGCLDSAVA